MSTPATDATTRSESADTDADSAAVPAEEPTRSGHWGFGHLPALDGLRGAAVAAVLIFHGGHLAGGYLGVDLFFVLSGFLITSLLLAEHDQTDRVGLGAFWSRRVRRLLPALVVLVIVVAVTTPALARPVDLATIRADGLATLAYVANWHAIVRGTSYWDISLAPSPFQHTWSLAIEEQFYLLWPLIFVAVARRHSGSVRVRVQRWAGALAIVSAVWLIVLYASGASETRVYQGTDTRAAALLGGVALAAWARGQRTPTAVEARRAGALGGAAAVALGLLWVTLSGTSPWLYRGGLALASALAVVVVGAVARSASGPLVPVLSVRPLRWLGLISYGLYLWHWPIFGYLNQYNGRYAGLGDLRLGTAALFAVQVGASLLVATASYRFVEQPIRRGSLSGWPLVGASVAAVAVAVVALVVGTSGAVPSATPRKEVGQAKVVIAKAPTVLFVGDSVALSLVAPVVDDPDAFGINPINRTYIGCSPVSQGRPTRSFAGFPTDPPPCYRDLDEDLPTLKPDAVLLLVGSRPNDEVQVDGTWVGACDPAFDLAYRDAMADLARRLQASGAPVVVGLITRTSANAVVIIEDSDPNIACVNKQLRTLEREVPGVQVIDPNELVCPDRRCLEEIDGHVLRPDGLHFADGPGGELVAHWVLDEMLAAAGLPPAKPGG